MSVKSLFEDRIRIFGNHQRQHEKLAQRYAMLRALAFVIAVGLVVVYFRTGSVLYLISTLLPIAIFAHFVNRYSHHENQKRYFGQLIAINQEELDRIGLKLSGFKEGTQYFEKGHPYQYDLDVFGEHSLFQLINHCALEDSEQLLASWLSRPAAPREIANRQSAIQELSRQIDWFQDFLANSRMAVNKRRKEEPAISASILMQWVQKESTAGNISAWKTGGVLLCLTSITLVFITIAGLAPYQVIYPGLLLNGIFLGFTIRQLKPLISGLDKAHYMVSTYYQAITSIEKATFHSGKLLHLQEELLKDGKASYQIRRLTRITQRIHSRSNAQFYLILDLFFLLDAFLVTDILRWKKENTEHVGHWLQVIHEFEALISIAAFAKTHPQYSWPGLSERTFHLSGKKIGHPLIDPAQMVANDYQIDGKGSIDIITGSNMSGKSTFQRTLGVNLVLANMGAPVCAENFRWSPCLIFTSMRTKDNLEENTSSFYAELKRIRQLLDLTEREQVFLLLDEILKGTNSQDRHKGAIALTLKLTQKTAFGLISTHDLALGNLAEEHVQIRNFSFNSQMADDKIQFDYRLTPGICKSFNASQLMKNMGIID